MEIKHTAATSAAIHQPAQSSAGAVAFDYKYYLRTYADVRVSLFAQRSTDLKAGALEHFNKHGAFEGRNPSAHFNTSAYLNKYPDVRTSGMNPLDHYNNHGVKEGRDPMGGVRRPGSAGEAPEQPAAQDTVFQLHGHAADGTAASVTQAVLHGSGAPAFVVGAPGSPGGGAYGNPSEQEFSWWGFFLTPPDIPGFYGATPPVAGAHTLLALPANQAFGATLHGADSQTHTMLPGTSGDGARALIGA